VARVLEVLASGEKIPSAPLPGTPRRGRTFDKGIAL
jgi:hypothetical protein